MDWLSVLPTALFRKHIFSPEKRANMRGCGRGRGCSRGLHRPPGDTMELPAGFEDTQMERATSWTDVIPFVGSLGSPNRIDAGINPLCVMICECLL